MAEWDLFQSLEAVLQTGSLSAAARLRGLTQPTLGRHIEALERRLGAPLFVRSPRGLQPTELALDLRPHLQEMAASAAAALREGRHGAAALEGAVRLTASEVIGAEVLPTVLAAFRSQHPRIAVELVLSNETQDLLRREADIAVRMAPPTQGALVARKIGEIPLALYATREHLAANGRPDSLADLAGRTLIGVDSLRRMTQIAGLDLPVTREMFAFRSDSDLAQLAAIRAGFGIGVCQAPLGRRYGLERVLPEHTVYRLGVWIVMHEDLKASRRMRAMFDHLVESLSAYVADAA
ncbi:LysR family transcriptional regulator [Phenylobacterium sp. LjRoot225]|uniref:LysR family transcriptional regulator n=1 Tax=Phenylobacterium sp. LjRoot225 TaxID=3342285 RepID=UPI003ECF4BB1